MTQIEQLIEEELQRANDKFGPFNSAHEGFGILYEEFDETRGEWEYIERQVRQLIFGIRRGYDPSELDYIAGILYTHCQLAIAELIQVAAMSRKMAQYLERGETK